MYKLLSIFVLIFVSGILNASSSLSISLVNLSMNYTERDDVNILSNTERSVFIPGLELQYAIPLSPLSNLEQDLSFKTSLFKGETEYDGYYLSGEPTYQTTLNILFDISGEYKQRISFNNTSLFYGAGIGYHSWYRELSGTQNELYSWYYASMMLGVSQQISQEATLKPFFVYKHGLNPEMKANDFSEAFELGGQNTIEMHLPIDIIINEDTVFNFTYVFALQTIEKSKYYSGTVGTISSDTWHEPKSKDYQNYLKFGMTFKY